MKVQGGGVGIVGRSVEALDSGNTIPECAAVLHKHGIAEYMCSSGQAVKEKVHSRVFVALVIV